MNGPRFREGQVVEVILPGDITGGSLVGRRFALFGDPVLWEGQMWAWCAPPPWARELGLATGDTFQIQECRLKLIAASAGPDPRLLTLGAQRPPYDGRVKVSWDACPWKPHLDVVPHPRDPDRLVNVWDPVDGEAP